MKVVLICILFFSFLVNPANASDHKLLNNGLPAEATNSKGLKDLDLPPINPSNKYYEFEVAGNGDLYIIKKKGTDSRYTEVHVLSAASDYKQYIQHTVTCLPETDENWDFELTIGNDLFIIKKQGFKFTEVHILSKSSNYQVYTKQVPTGLEKTDATWDFELSINFDLFAIKKQGVNFTEVHVLSALSDYQQFTMHQATALGKTDENWNFELDNGMNLYAIKKLGANFTEVHILSRTNSYTQFSMHLATALNKTDENWDFVMPMVSVGDIFAICRSGGSKMTEVHVLQASSSFTTFRNHYSTAMASTNTQPVLPTRNFSFAATADPQYNGENRENYPAADAVLSSLSKSIGPGNTYLGLIVAGDITQFTQKGEIKEFYKHFVDGIDPASASSTLNDLLSKSTSAVKLTSVYEGLGNHDYSNGGCCATVGDRYNCECPDVLKQLVSRTNRNYELGNSLVNYSWNWQGIHFVQLNIAPANGMVAGFDSYNSLKFLKDDLAKWASDGQPVVIVHHFGVDDFSKGKLPPKYEIWWTEAQINAYWDVIAKYRIAAIITGHAHDIPGLQEWNRPAGRSNGPALINTFEAGSAMFGYWLDFNVFGNTMTVTTHGKSVPVKSYVF